MPTIETCIYHAPCADLVLGTLDGRLCLCDWTASQRGGRTQRRVERLLNATLRPGTNALLEATAAQLDEYFVRRRSAFSLPLLPAGTDFQRAVWQALCRIPYGTTLTYAQLAAAIGRPTAVRAVANAIGANALSIIVPCHRVVGSNGSLTGFAGGLNVKRYLINLETTSINLQIET